MDINKKPSLGNGQHNRFAVAWHPGRRRHSFATMNNHRRHAVIISGQRMPISMKRHEYQLVLTTCPDAGTAERIANALVTERLAACVNIVPVAKSVYLWKGRLESAAEQLLIIKSMARQYRALEKRILDLHPYELPEVLAVPVADGNASYLGWIRNPDKSR
jgi:periplasmic divalent cation tolerance protein